MPLPPCAPGPPADLEPFHLSPHDRWVLAACIAQRLAPAARAWGGFASAELQVAVGGGPLRRPAVAVVRGELPVAPVLCAPPLLVVELAPDCAPQQWLACGVAVVWSLGCDGAWVSARGASPHRVPAPGRLELAPGEATTPTAPLALALPVHPAAPVPPRAGSRVPIG